MPQAPARRHVLADVRITAGLSQKGLAKLLRVAGITVQKIEQGHLALSEELARKAEGELGVSAAWLLANDPKTRPVTPRGGRWTKDLYEFTQGGNLTVTNSPVIPPEAVFQRPLTGLRMPLTFFSPDEIADEFTAWQIAECSARVASLLAGAKGTPRQGILLHRLRQNLNALAEDFPSDPGVMKEYAPRIARARAAFERKSKQIAEEETQQLWSDPKKPRPRPS